MTHPGTQSKTLVAVAAVVAVAVTGAMVLAGARGLRAAHVATAVSAPAASPQAMLAALHDVAG